MSFTLEGFSDSLTFQINNKGIEVHGRGIVSVTVFTPLGEAPDDDDHASAAGWILAAYDEDGGLPDILKHSRTLLGRVDIAERAKGKDVVILVPPVGANESAWPGEPHVGVIFVLSSAKLRRIVEMLRYGSGAGRWSYEFSGITLVVFDVPGDRDSRKWLSFDAWLANGEPNVCVTDVEFTARPFTIDDVDGENKLARRLDVMRNWMIGLVSLTALSVALQCARV